MPSKRYFRSAHLRKSGTNACTVPERRRTADPFSKIMSDEKDQKQKCKTGNCALFDRLMSTKTKTIVKIFVYSVLAPAILYAMFFLFLHYQDRFKQVVTRVVEVKENRPTYWVYTKKNETGYLKHVHAVLERLGFQRGNNESDWDLLWAHDYPFRVFPSLKRLPGHKRVNHFPGCGYITNKVDLSTSGGRFMPAAFKIPEEAEQFLRYAKENPQKSFVEKSNDHRGINIRRVEDINIRQSGSFVQEFIEKPFLVDGYKFDVGVYTVITSVDPLRVYVFKADVLFRFCPVKYYPFDPNIPDKYVVSDDYLPIWEVPSLKKYYTQLGFSMKDSFDAYVRSQGKDPRKVWNGANEAIREVALMKEAQIKEIVKHFGDRRNFFELVRFDFTLDEDLNVYTMEANMSPNLSSAHFAPNQILYEQVIFNLFALVGVGQRTRKSSLRIRSKTEKDMAVTTKNLVVLPEVCAECDDCFRVECQLCSPCFTSETELILSQSYLEHQNKMEYQRIFPPPITKEMELKDYTLKNQLLIRWYQGKCELDYTWCN